MSLLMKEPINTMEQVLPLNSNMQTLTMIMASIHLKYSSKTFTTFRTALSWLKPASKTGKA